MAGGWAGLYNDGLGVTGGNNGVLKEYTDINLMFSDLEDSGNDVEIYRYTGTDAELSRKYTFTDIHNKTVVASSGQIISKKELRNTYSSNIIWGNFLRRGPYEEDNQIDYFTCNSCHGMVYQYLDMDGEGVYAGNGSDAYPDGCIDINLSSYVTVSHCKFANTTRGMLFGYGDTETANRGLLNITVQYCWFLNCAARQPKGRYGEIHVVNCFFNWEPSWTTHPGPLPGSSNMLDLDSEAQVYVENCRFKDGSELRRDNDGMATKTSGLKFVGCEVINFTSGSLSGIREENVLWTPSEVPGYTYDIPLMTLDETETYVRQWAGATYHLIGSEPETYALTTQVNNVLGGSISEVTTGSDEGKYEEGEIATVTVTVNGGYYFTGFSSDQVPDSGTFPYSFPFPGEPVLITALFSTTPPPPPSGASFRFVFPTDFYAPRIWDAYQKVKNLNGEVGASLKDIKRVADKLLAFDWDMLSVPFANKDSALISLIGPDLVVIGGGNGSRWDKNGLLVTELPNDRPRFTYNPAVVGKYEGVYVEVESENIRLYSENIANNYWETFTIGIGSLPIITDNFQTQNGILADKVLYEANSLSLNDGGRINGPVPIISGELYRHQMLVKSLDSNQEVLLFFGGVRTNYLSISEIPTLINLDWIPSSSYTGLAAGLMQLGDMLRTTGEFLILYSQVEINNKTSYIKTTSDPVTRPADIIQSIGLINTASPYSLFEIRNGQGILRYIEPAEGTVKTYVDGAYINTDSFTPSEDLIINSQGSDKLLAAGYKSGVMTEQERIVRSMVIVS